MKSALKSIADYFRTAAKRAKQQILLQDVFAELSRQVNRRLTLSDEYHFKGACASLLDTTGFIPSSYIREIARITNNRELMSQAEEIDRDASFRVHDELRGRIN